jgi:hypothetical protein
MDEENLEVAEAALCSLLRQHGSIAIAGLVRMIHTSRSDRLRVSAINMLLDLGYGRPPRASDIAARNPPPIRPYIEHRSAQERVTYYQKALEVAARLLTAAIDRDREAATHSDAYGPDCLPPPVRKMHWIMLPLPRLYQGDKNTPALFPALFESFRRTLINTRRVRQIASMISARRGATIRSVIKNQHGGFFDPLS